MNQTKFHIGDSVVHRERSLNSRLPMEVERIRSNGLGENEYQLTHHSAEDNLINTEWFNERDLAYASGTSNRI